MTGRIKSGKTKMVPYEKRLNTEEYWEVQQSRLISRATETTTRLP